MKRGQITLFVILAIAIIIVVVFVFNVQIRNSIKNVFVPSTPETQFGDCVSPMLKENLNLIMKQGGNIIPQNYILDNDVKIEYLCFTNQYYQTCKLQQPLLKQHIERQLLEKIKASANACAEQLKTNLESKGYRIISDGKEASVEILPNKIKIGIPGLSFQKDDKVQANTNFGYTYNTNLYEMIMIANSILNYESVYGDSDTTVYMFYYPGTIVEKNKKSDGSKIYTIRNDKEKFVFASRSLSWPPGYGGLPEFVPAR